VDYCFSETKLSCIIIHLSDANSLYLSWGTIVSMYLKCTATSANAILLESSEKQKSIECSYKKDLAVVCSANAKLFLPLLQN